VKVAPGAWLLRWMCGSKRQHDVDTAVVARRGREVCSVRQGAVEDGGVGHSTLV